MTGVGNMIKRFCLVVLLLHVVFHLESTNAFLPKTTTTSCSRASSLTLLSLSEKNEYSSSSSSPSSLCHRRDMLKNVAMGSGMFMFGMMFAGGAPAAAAQADCYNDCFKNCKLIAPQDVKYCGRECTDYCELPDRTDGLSGSVSAASGEVGILGGSFGVGTVVKGEDKPPSIKLPGLDFTSGSGRKLIGY
mmetsp:Transcript_37250/g.57205  ORF Transcript_37250/g.57205 Transcript_37250/m.57205 type:complete len:190 (+) Transcript_37250:3-572(+)